MVYCRYISYKLRYMQGGVVSGFKIEGAIIIPGNALPDWELLTLLLCRFFISIVVIYSLLAICQDFFCLMDMWVTQSICH